MGLSWQAGSSTGVAIVIKLPIISRWKILEAVFFLVQVQPHRMDLKQALLQQFEDLTYNNFGNTKYVIGCSWKRMWCAWEEKLQRYQNFTWYQHSFFSKEQHLVICHMPHVDKNA